MNENTIREISEIVFKQHPNQIIRQKIGICNEVFELTFDSDSFIIRLNEHKGILYGTHQFLPLFKKLQINTPEIVAEDYSKTQIPFCYQILTKIEGKDLGLVVEKLSPSNLKLIASEISDIFEKFNSLPFKKDFGVITGYHEERFPNLLEVIENQKKRALERNAKTEVLDEETLDIYNELLQRYKEYFLGVKPKLYYDDICSKNVMIHEGKFSGLVDLDFLIKGDYLEAIGRIMCSWYGQDYGRVYLDEIIKKQRLDRDQQRIIKLYAILNLIGWLSEEGIKFNSNSSGIVNWENVKRKRETIKAIYQEIG